MFGPIDGEGDLENGEIDLTIKPTHDTYEPLQYAYEHFNLALFDHRLPNCLITLQRKGRCFGYFAAGRMTRRDGATCDEIALNPVHFREQGDLQTLSILVHEMVHLWQKHFGTPGRGRYHNLQWAAKMKQVGLYPSQTGQPGGRETGDQMWHYIIEGGAFDQAARQLIAAGFVILWTEEARLAAPRRRRSRDQGEPGLAGEAAQEGTPSDPLGGEDDWVDLEGGDGIREPDGREHPSRSGRREKYACPVCAKCMWTSHGAFALCAEHAVPLVLVG